ncbi:hypothetical protein H6503_02410 [Candidatus Woesearchaeota archaeon]|nr:hypothetical protein [Candidatus Woesearchaeota archaeon]
MVKKGSQKQRYNFLIDKKVYDEFSMLCEELGLVRSKKVELFMKEFLDRQKEVSKK